MTASERKLQILDSIARLRRVERELPENRDVATVRLRLERELGRSVSQRLAAKAVGVSHTALQHWIASGDVPTVYTPEGRREVPISTVLELSGSVDEAKADHGRTGHYLEPALRANRERAARLQEQPLPSASTLRDRDDGHSGASLRALAVHEAIARRLDRETVRYARSMLWRLREEGRIHPRYADAWEELLAGDLDQIRLGIVADTEHGRDLRQNSPFAGALSEAERREVMRQVAR